MKKRQQNFYTKISISHIALCASVMAMYTFASPAASVVARGSTTASSRPTVSSSTRVTGRMPTATTNLQAVETTETEEETITEPVEEEIIVENKASQFDTALSSSSTSTTDSSAENLAEMIRQQRAALDAQDAIETASKKTQSGNGNACDISLRSCMQEKCGEDFTKCSGDTDTEWGNKLESCRLDSDCSGREYTLFATEIKADRDLNANLASYNSVITCGNQYNDCIMTECGETFTKCLNKSLGDVAIEKCKTIANNCKEQDSGLAARAMLVFGNLRQDAEIQVQEDEKRLYALRDQMSNECDKLGAMFDERTFSCVYTVNFYAGENTTLYASKKLYAGDVFSCTPDWFGIDVTTFMENAYRLTREQTSASSALLGSGLGVAAGAITSGAIGRAIDRQKAENALKDAKEEHEDSYGDKDGTASEQTDEETEKASSEESEEDSRPAQEELKENCEANGGTWKDNFCSEPECPEGEFYDDFTGTCKEDKSIKASDLESRCEIAGGTWNNTLLKCICSNGGNFNLTTGICESVSLDLDTSIGITSSKLPQLSTGIRTLSTRGVSSR